MDVLTDMLARSRARGAGFAYSTLHGVAGVSFPPGPGLGVHVIVDGEVWLGLDSGAEPVRVATGDVIVVQGAGAHRLAVAPDTPCIPLVDLMARGPLAPSSRHYAVGELGGRPCPRCSSAAPTCSRATCAGSCWRSCPTW